MALKAILFDLDDTLIVDEAASNEALEYTARTASEKFGVQAEQFKRDSVEIAKSLWAESPVYDHCRNIGISAFECLWGNFSGDEEWLQQLHAWSNEFRPAVFDAALRRQDIDDPEAGPLLAEAFGGFRRQLARLMPNATEVVAELAREYKLGLLTNGAPAFQRDKFHSSGLHHAFDAAVISGDHGIGKPKPEIFQRLLSELEVSPEQAVMVGNSLERDIAGARNAGIRSIWIRVPGSEEPDEVEPDHEILDLSELSELLEQIKATADV